MIGSPELQTLLEEIHEQPTVAAGLLQSQADRAREVAQAIVERAPRAVVFVARGSSDNAAVYGRYLFEVCNRQLTSLAAPSGLTLYGSGPRLSGTVVIAVSQSGRGEDVVTYTRTARAQGALTVAIVNDTSSPLAQSADWVLDCSAGPELSIPATKTVTAQMLLMAMLSTAMQAGDRQPFGDLALLPDALARAVAMRPDAAQVAERLEPTQLGSVIGRGFAFPPALEIALKLKETSYTAAEPFSAADFTHGPVALVERGFSALVIDVGGRSSAAADEASAAIRARGGQPAVIRAGQVAGPDGDAMSLTVPITEPFAPIVALVLGQLVAVELALARGVDPARPRGLRKVTSTR